MKRLLRSQPRLALTLPLCAAAVLAASQVNAQVATEEEFAAILSETNSLGSMAGDTNVLQELMAVLQSHRASGIGDGTVRRSAENTNHLEQTVTRWKRA